MYRRQSIDPRRSPSRCAWGPPSPFNDGFMCWADRLRSSAVDCGLGGSRTFLDRHRRLTHTSMTA